MRTNFTSKTLASIVAGITVGLTAWVIFGSAPAKAEIETPTCCSGVDCDNRAAGTGGAGSGAAPAPGGGTGSSNAAL